MTGLEGDDSFHLSFYLMLQHLQSSNQPCPILLPLVKADSNLHSLSDVSHHYTLRMPSAWRKKNILYFRYEKLTRLTTAIGESIFPLGAFFTQYFWDGWLISHPSQSYWLPSHMTYISTDHTSVYDVKADISSTIVHHYWPHRLGRSHAVRHHRRSAGTDFGALLIIVSVHWDLRW